VALVVGYKALGIKLPANSTLEAEKRVIFTAIHFISKALLK
jgi:hypothetical protein